MQNYIFNSEHENMYKCCTLDTVLYFGMWKKMHFTFCVKRLYNIKVKLWSELDRSFERSCHSFHKQKFISYKISLRGYHILKLNYKLIGKPKAKYIIVPGYSIERSICNICDVLFLMRDGSNIAAVCLLIISHFARRNIYSKAIVLRGPTHQKL